MIPHLKNINNIKSFFFLRQNAKLIKMEEILLFRKKMLTLLLFIYFFLKRRVTTPTCGYLNSSVFFKGSNEEIGNNFN